MQSPGGEIVKIFKRFPEKLLPGTILLLAAALRIKALFSELQYDVNQIILKGPGKAYPATDNRKQTEKTQSQRKDRIHLFNGSGKYPTKQYKRRCQSQ